jgi:multiple sugar transport system substrate-binding protein
VGARQALASSSRTPVTLEFWNPATDQLGHKYIAQVVNDFNQSVGQQHGIVVRDRTVPASDNYVKYTTAMEARSGSPDAVMTYAYAPVAPWAANGFVQPLDAYAQAVGVRQSDYFPFAWEMLHINGHIWGLLQEFDMDQLYWNKAIHSGPPPKTIAELDALAAQYTTFDTKGNLLQVGIIPWATGAAVSPYYDWGALWGASFYDHARGKWTINTPQNRKFLEWMLKYVHLLGGRAKAAGLISALPTNLGGDVFMAGKAAFWLEGEWQPTVIPSTAPTLRYGIAHLPTAPGVPYGTGVAGGGNLFLLPTNAPHPQEAAVFIKYMASDHALTEYDLQEGILPPTKSLVFSPRFLKALPYMTAYVETLKLNHIVPAIPSPQFPLFDEQMTNAVDEVTFLRKTPAEALAHVEQQISTAVQQFRQTHPAWPSE